MIGTAHLLILALLAASASAAESAAREGLLALQAGDAAAAATLLERAVEQDPNDGAAWLGLAQARRKLDEPERAETALERARKLAAKAPILIRAIALYHADNGEPAEAAEAAARFARAAPEAPGALPQAAAFALAAGRPADAVEFARSALEREETAALRNLLGKALAETGQPDEAEHELRRAIELAPYDEELRYDLGYFYLLGRRFEQAAESFEAGLELFDKSARLELGLGIARYGQRRFDEATAAFLRAATLAPAVEQPQYFLGRMLQHAGDRLPDVLARFEAYSRARPESYLGPFLQAKALLAAAPPAGDAALFHQAESLLRRSIERQPKFWESHFELGVLLDRMERREEAAEALERAVTLSPRSPAPHYRLARVYSRLGKRDLAKSEAETHGRLEQEAREALNGGRARSLEEAVIE